MMRQMEGCSSIKAPRRWKIFCKRWVLQELLAQVIKFTLALGKGGKGDASRSRCMSWLPGNVCETTLYICLGGCHRPAQWSPPLQPHRTNIQEKKFFAKTNIARASIPSVCLQDKKFLCKGMPSRQLSKDKPKKGVASRARTCFQNNWARTCLQDNWARANFYFNTFEQNSNTFKKGQIYKCCLW